MAAPAASACPAFEMGPLSESSERRAAASPEQPGPEQPGAEQPAPEQPGAEQPAPEQPGPPGAASGHLAATDAGSQEIQPSDARNMAMLAHLSALVALVVGISVMGPLIVWLVKKDESAFIDAHGKEAVNFNLSVLIYGVAGVVFSVATLGIGLLVVLPVAVVLFVAWFVLVIVAGIKASNGEHYRYPLTIRLIT